MTEPTQTSDLILDAAERLFARQGFTATTIKQIGKAANVNPALLYYYYDSKETLYRAMLQRILGELLAEDRQRFDVLVTENMFGDILSADFEDFLESRPDLGPNMEGELRRVVKLLAEHPHFPQLFVREMIDHQAAHAEQAFTGTAAAAFKGLCEVIEAGQRDGVFRRSLDPRFAAISTIAQIAYFVIARPAVGLLLGHGTDGPPPEMSESFFAHAEAFALDALLVDRAEDALT